MVREIIRLAYGGMSVLRTGRISVVSSLAAAISDVELDAADHRLDREHHPYVPYVALARTWASVGCASGLVNAGGIRMRRDRSRSYRFAPDPATAHTRCSTE